MGRCGLQQVIAFIYSYCIFSYLSCHIRVKSCLKLIAAQLHAQAVKGVGITPMDPSSSSTDGGQLSKRSARRERRLHMLSCNDIIAPPLWVLPLVHSPQYLAHLWELAEEAKDGDLYVPLEFDTEWDIAENVPGDSDMDSDGTDREESSGRGRKKSSMHILKKEFTIEKGFKDLLGMRMRQSIYISNIVMVASFFWPFLT